VKSLWRAIAGVYQDTSYYVKSVGGRYFTDDVFFYASSLSFQVVLCLIPTVLLLIWALSTVIPQSTVLRQVEYITYYALPRRVHPVDEFRRMLMSRTELFMRHKGLYGALGAAGFFWTSLAMMSTVRKTIFHIIGVEINQSFIRQTLYDLRMLLIAGFFLTASTAVTALFAGVREVAFQLPPGHVRFAIVRIAVPILSGFGLTFLLYFSIYRFLSFGKLKSGPAAFGAVWAALLFEAAKNLFALYISNAGNLNLVYGTLELVVGLLLWIFYSTTVFILGVELSNANLKRERAV
jgi:membrane protein